MEKFDISKDLLLYLYVRKDMTLTQVANELGCSRQTVSNYVQKYGICKEKFLRNVPKAPYEDYTTFVDAYKSLKSFKKMASHFKCSYDTIITWKGIHGVKASYSLTPEELSRRKSVASEFSKENLFKLYIVDLLSANEIGTLLGCDGSTILNYLRTYNIPTRNLSEQWAVKEKGRNVLNRASETDYQFLLRCLTFIPENPNNRVFERIKGIVGYCQLCGFNENVKLLDVHHIDCNKKNNHPENFIVLCPNCHAKVHRLGLNILPDDFNSWIKIVEDCAKASGEFFSYADAK